MRAGRRRERRKPLFDRAAVRRREIERHARHVGGDLTRHLNAWVWHNDTNRRDPVGALMEAGKAMRTRLSEADAREILDNAADMPRIRNADRLAGYLGITYAQRELLRITTIGAVDVNKKGRAMLRKQKRRQRKERERRERGMKPRAEYEASSLSRTKPWKAAGVSRRTWYRRRREAKALAA